MEPDQIPFDEVVSPEQFGIKCVLFVFDLERILSIHITSAFYDNNIRSGKRQKEEFDVKVALSAERSNQTAALWNAGKNLKWVLVGSLDGMGGFFMRPNSQHDGAMKKKKKKKKKKKRKNTEILQKN
eukprot:jgi/Bigna1/147286/aug1.138_g21994